MEAQYLSCKKATLKAGAIGEAALEACLSGDPNSIAADPKGKITKTRMKLLSDIEKDCPNSFTVYFPSACSNSGILSAGCFETNANCRICQALNAIDNLSVDCDLYDDSTSNGSCPSREGQVVGGSVWYLGTAGQNCDQVCASVGKVYSAATRTFAGDIGSDANCQAVLNALGIAGPLTYPSYSACVAGGGCVWESAYGSVRCINFPTTSTAAYPITNRACACQ